MSGEQVVRPMWVFFFLLRATTALAETAIPDRCRVAERGREREFEIALDELHVTSPRGERRVVKIAPRASVEAVREHARTRQTTTGAQYDLVLYEVGQPRSDFTRRLLTKQVAVRAAAGLDAAALAAACGARVLGQVPCAPGWYLFEVSEPGGALELCARLRGHPGVLAVEPQLARQLQKKFVPNDPLFPHQWHLLNTGQNGATPAVDLRVTNVWNTYRGESVRIAIVDDGVEWTHPDLTNRYEATYSWDFNQGDANPAPDPANQDFHGTACAGLAAADGNNGLGVCGVAFRASLVGLRLIARPSTDADEAAALSHSNAVIHLYSNSWGVPDGWEKVDGPGPLAHAALVHGVTHGRGGKGNIYVFPSGNGLEYGEDANYDGYANSIYTIAVAAITDTNTLADYSEPGACVHVCAPSSGGRQDIVTTDLVGNEGYNVEGSTGELSDRDYTKTFGGTSAAVPLVAGVCALILQANPDLGWRDIQEILMRSASWVAPWDPDWRTNSAGFRFNHKFGAGLVNAEAAVSLATNRWRNLGPQVRSTMAYTNLAVPIPDNSSNGVTFIFRMASAPTLRVEHVTVTVNILHPYRGDLAITLTSPSGMISRLAEAHEDPNDNFGDWTFSSVRHWGESSSGDWTVRIADLGALDTGTVTSVRLDIYGTASEAFLSISDAAWAEAKGNGNGQLDPGETITETVVLRNLGTVPATQIASTLSTTTPGVTGLQTNSPYPDLPPDGATSNAIAFRYRLAKTIPPGTKIEWTHVAVANGISFTNRFERWVGLATAVYATNTFTNAVATAIPDTSTVYSAIQVALPSNSVLADVDVSLRIVHPYVGDLQLALQHPGGREIMLSDRNGEDGRNYGTTSTYTTFDDSASWFIYEGTPPYAGTYRPEGRLADLNGKFPNGTWRLRVTDTGRGDTGTLMGWRLRLAWYTNRYTVSLYNTPPVAWPASYSIPDGTPTNLIFIGTDEDDDPLTVLVPQGPVPNPFPYTPPSGFTGMTNLAFSVTDGFATSSVAWITLHIFSSSLDSDGDGASDWHEFLAGTDPNDRSSVLRFISSAASGLRFVGVTGRTYRIEYKNDLREPEWFPLLTTNGVGTMIELVDPEVSNLRQRFYRIRLLSPP